MRLSNICSQLETINKTKQSLAAFYYLQAFCARPTRAEPLIKLAQYYWNKHKPHTAFLFCARAVQIPYPDQDILFIEKDLYDFVRYDLLGRCAWYVGQYELGAWAVRQALKVSPKSEYLKHNFACYTKHPSTQESTSNLVLIKNQI